jgi:hypothetical protein
MYKLQAFYAIFENWATEPRGDSKQWQGISRIFHPEDHARAKIDDALAAAGWVVQTRAQTNLGAGLGIAVQEFPTDSGPVDYALFVGRELCGVIEAKPAGTTLSGFAEQAARYIAGVPSIWCIRRGRSGSNTWRRAARCCFAITRTRPLGPGVSLLSIGPRPCRVG